MVRLGDVYMDQRKVGEVEAWYLSVIEIGDVWGMFYLGRLLVQQRRLDEAEYWYQCAADMDDETILGVLGIHLGNL